jgi:hypothetical protein
MSYCRRGEAHLFLARRYREANDDTRTTDELNEAITNLTLASEADPTFASAFAIRSVAHALLKHEEESEADLEKAVSLGAEAVTIRKAIKATKSWRTSGPQSSVRRRG